ncbi:hypothetical protein ACFQV8_20305 [Pseudonocardia benzenivorans]
MQARPDADPDPDADAAGDDPAVLRSVAERVAREAAEHLRSLPPPRSSADGDGVGTSGVPCVPSRRPPTS